MDTILLVLGVLIIGVIGTALVTSVLIVAVATYKERHSDDPIVLSRRTPPYDQEDDD